MTQWEPLPLNLFNVVVDAVVHQYAEEMVDIVGGKGRSGQEGRHQNSLFYADNNILALSDSVWIQGAFITLVGLFD